jgi:hypothetical protein
VHLTENFYFFSRKVPKKKLNFENGIWLLIGAIGFFVFWNMFHQLENQERDEISQKLEFAKKGMLAIV